MVIGLDGNRVWMVIGLEGDRKVRIIVQYLIEVRVITKKNLPDFTTGQTPILLQFYYE